MPRERANMLTEMGVPVLLLSSAATGCRPSWYDCSSLFQPFLNGVLTVKVAVSSVLAPPPLGESSVRGGGTMTFCHFALGVPVRVKTTWVCALPKLSTTMAKGMGFCGLASRVAELTLALM